MMNFKSISGCLKMAPIALVCVLSGCADQQGNAAMGEVLNGALAGAMGAVTGGGTGAGGQQPTNNGGDNSGYGNGGGYAVPGSQGSAPGGLLGQAVQGYSAQKQGRDGYISVQSPVSSRGLTEVTIDGFYQMGTNGNLGSDRRINLYEVLSDGRHNSQPTLAYLGPREAKTVAPGVYFVTDGYNSDVYLGEVEIKMGALNRLQVFLKK